MDIREIIDRGYGIIDLTERHEAPPAQLSLPGVRKGLIDGIVRYERGHMTIGQLGHCRDCGCPISVFAGQPALCTECGQWTQEEVA